MHKKPYDNIFTPLNLFWLIGTYFLSALLNNLVHYGSTNINILQIAFLRNSLSLIIALPLLVPRKVFILKTRKIKMHIIRGIMGTVSMFFWFASLKYEPIAKANTIVLISPIISIILAWIFFNENINFKEIISIILGFIGVFIIFNPQNMQLQKGDIFLLCAIFSLSTIPIITKVLSKTESSITTMVYFSILSSIITLVPAIIVWEPLTIYQWMSMIAIGVTGGIYQIFSNQAIAKTSVRINSQFRFSEPVIGSLLAFLLFNEIPTLNTYIGAFIIALSLLLILIKKTNTT